MCEFKKGDKVKSFRGVGVVSKTEGDPSKFNRIRIEWSHRPPTWEYPENLELVSRA
ncbi:unnamed protein product, partial [marine sediment metagenome]